MGLGSDWMSNSGGQNGTDYGWDQGTDSATASDSSGDTFSSYMAGAYSFNSFALSSVALSSSATDSESASGGDQEIDFGTDQGSASFVMSAAMSMAYAAVGSSGSQDTMSGASTGANKGDILYSF